MLYRLCFAICTGGHRHRGADAAQRADENVHALRAVYALLSVGLLVSLAVMRGQAAFRGKNTAPWRRWPWWRWRYSGGQPPMPVVGSTYHPFGAVHPARERSVASIEVMDSDPLLDLWATFLA